MQSGKSRERAERFFRLHEQERPLVLIDAWDGGSARILERAGAAAIGVSTSGIAWSFGCAAAGELLQTDLIDTCARICRSVSVPVTVDLGDRWGTTADDLGELLAALIDVGVSGVDLQERAFLTPLGCGHTGTLSGHIADLRARVRLTNARFFINAQVDAARDPNEEERTSYHEAVGRAQSYASAGVDGIFVRGIHLGDVVRFARAVTLPVTVDCGDGWAPPVYGLARTGVRRISLRSGPLLSAFELFRRISTETLSRGCYDTMIRNLPPGGARQSLFSVKDSR